MKKTILFTVLLILFLSFVALIFNAFQLQKGYFGNKEKASSESNVIQTDEKIITPSFYKDYSKEDYDLALKDKRVLVLYFTSNWCKECLEQDNLNSSVFSDLYEEGIVGLRIHILDSETTQETDALAKKFDVTKEQSIVILDKSGAVKYKNVGIITNEKLKEEIMKLR